MKFTAKALADYKNLKKFSENALHELQTPLDIIRAKTEILLEGNRLPNDQLEKLQADYQNVNRLSKINSNLLLLTKIESR
jgi:signal transduction histidine kinase